MGMNKAKPSPAAPADDVAFAQHVLATESQAIARIQLDAAFGRAVELITARTGRDAHGSVVTSGMGKSGIIAQKLSATLASTGTPSHYLHPAEAMHGDLGRIRRGDVVILLSYGGETDELISLAAILKQDNVPVVALTGSDGSSLARLATEALCVGDITEACPHNLAPTASTAALLALGDALAMTVSRRRAFSVEDFKKVHPGGGLGRQLTPVVTVMRFKAGENLPLIDATRTVEQAYAEASRVAATTGLRKAGALVIVDAHGRLTGIFTDGDLRRLILDGGGDLRQPIAQVMTRDPKHLSDDALVRDAVQMVRELRIDEVPVVDAKGKPVGLIDVQDLMALKVIEG